MDFLLQINQEIHPFEVKLAIQGISKAVPYPTKFQKHFSCQHPLVIITLGGNQLQLSPSCLIVPITQLHDYLKKL